MFDYNLIFAPTARAEASIKGHAANLTTYGLIAAIVVLTGVIAVLDFISEHYSRREEYALMLTIAKLKTKRWFIRRAIAVAEFVAYNGFAIKAINAAAKAKELWSCKGEVATKAFDKVFALN